VLIVFLLGLNATMVSVVKRYLHNRCGDDLREEHQFEIESSEDDNADDFEVQPGSTVLPPARWHEPEEEEASSSHRFKIVAQSILGLLRIQRASETAEPNAEAAEPSAEQQARQTIRPSRPYLSKDFEAHRPYETPRSSRARRRNIEVELTAMDGAPPPRYQGSWSGASTTPSSTSSFRSRSTVTGLPSKRRRRKTGKRSAAEASEVKLADFEGVIPPRYQGSRSSGGSMTPSSDRSSQVGPVEFPTPPLVTMARNLRDAIETEADSASPKARRRKTGKRLDNSAEREEDEEEEDAPSADETRRRSPNRKSQEGSSESSARAVRPTDEQSPG